MADPANSSHCFFCGSVAYIEVCECIDVRFWTIWTSFRGPGTRCYALHVFRYISSRLEAPRCAPRECLEKNTIDVKVNRFRRPELIIAVLVQLRCVLMLNLNTLYRGAWSTYGTANIRRDDRDAALLSLFAYQSKLYISYLSELWSEPTAMIITVFVNLVPR